MYISTSYASSCCLRISLYNDLPTHFTYDFKYDQHYMNKIILQIICMNGGNNGQVINEETNAARRAAPFESSSVQAAAVDHAAKI